MCGRGGVESWDRVSRSGDMMGKVGRMRNPLLALFTPRNTLDYLGGNTVEFSEEHLKIT